MKNIDKNSLYQRLTKQASNSSHYVWLWSDLTFIETATGWIFGITTKIGIHLIALEPLPPIGQNIEEANFHDALKELKDYLGSGTIAFIAIYTPFAKKLKDFHFQSFQIGKEPWANLSDIKPTGHSSRKIRVAINQSTKAGLRIEEWKIPDVLQNQKQSSQLNQLIKRWEEQSFIALSGFLHGMTLNSIPEDRRCFVALTTNDQVEGFLITTPIVKGKSWYFEDTIINMYSSAHRGVGEHLTLYAMEVLKNDGYQEVSLGIVPMTTVGVSDFDHGPPSAFLKLVSSFQYAMGFFYNSSGLELFRRRFKLDRWDKIYLSVLVDEKKQNFKTFEWLKVLLALGLAYKPKLQIKLSFLLDQIMAPIKRYYISILFIAFSLAFFYFSNFCEAVAPWLSENSIFSPKASLWLLPLKTFFSTFFYLTNISFTVMLAALGGILLFIEKEVYHRKWTFYIIFAAIANDALIRLLCGISTHFFPDSTNQLQLINLFPSTGGSILLATLLGFSSTFAGPKKDKILAIGFFTYLFASIFGPIMHISTLNVLLHIIFYIEGHMFGKVYTFSQSKKDQMASKNKKPINGTI